MKCSECDKSGLRNKVFEGLCVGTCMAGPSFYDEDGRYHNHDPNSYTTSYRCSNGHEWCEVTHHHCWCEDNP